MNAPRHRPLGIGPLRAFVAVGRLLSFRGAAEELHLTQSAISRRRVSLLSRGGWCPPRPMAAPAVAAIDPFLWHMDLLLGDHRGPAVCHT